MLKFILTACVLAFPMAATASTVAPISYSYTSAPNGPAYFDDTYNGTLGQLTDGVSATLDWQLTEGFNIAGPNVGWENLNPIIVFVFDQVYSFGSLTMNFQDGQGRFGVGRPDTITVNGVTSPMILGGTIRTPLDTVMDLSALAPTDTLTVTVNRGFQWTFLSEFTFDTAASPVPLPAGLPLLLAGLGGLALLRRKS